jgi:hypothetical protein
MRRTHRGVVALIGTALVLGALAGSAARADNMTGPIDLGTVKTGLNSSQSIQPAPPRPPLKPRAPGRTAAPLKVSAFFGSFAGNGLADGADVAYFGVTQRDLDVKISPAGSGGFTVAWTTVLRDGGNPKAPNIRRRATAITFEPGPQPGLFHATDNGDPLAGGVLSWASVSGNTLKVHQFSVLPDGHHEIQTYARTLSGTGMTLIYTRAIEGDRQRRVRGQLVKNAD